MTLMEEMSRPLRAAASISAVRVRASAHDVMGGVMAMVCLPEAVSMVREEKVTSVNRGLEDALEER